MIKKISLLIIFFVISISAKAESNKEIIQKIASRFDDINNIQFDFIQTSNGLVEKALVIFPMPKINLQIFR